MSRFKLQVNKEVVGTVEANDYDWEAGTESAGIVHFYDEDSNEVATYWPAPGALIVKEK